GLAVDVVGHLGQHGPGVDRGAARGQVAVRGHAVGGLLAVGVDIERAAPLRQVALAERGRGPAVAEHAAVAVAVPVGARGAAQARQPAQVVRVPDLHAAVVALDDQVVDDLGIDVGRPLGLGFPVLEGDAEIDRRVPAARRVDDRVVGHDGVLRGIQADARVARVAHDVVAHDAVDGLVVVRVHPQVEVLRAGVEAGADAGVAGVLDPVALDHHVAGAALEVQAGGGAVVDVAVLDHHAVGVDVVDAVGVAVVATAGVADLDPADDGAVGLGRDLDAVAAGVAHEQVLHDHVGGTGGRGRPALVPVGLEHDSVVVAAADLQVGDATAGGARIHLDADRVGGRRAAGNVGPLARRRAQGQPVAQAHALVVGAVEDG